MLSVFKNKNLFFFALGESLYTTKDFRYKRCNFLADVNQFNSLHSWIALKTSCNWPQICALQIKGHCRWKFQDLGKTEMKFILLYYLLNYELEILSFYINQILSLVLMLIYNFTVILFSLNTRLIFKGTKIWLLILGTTGLQVTGRSTLWCLVHLTFNTQILQTIWGTDLQNSNRSSK